MSKELEQLKQIRHDFYINGKVDYDSISYFTNIERALQALEIIKTKKLDVCSFINNFVERNNSYETYVLYFEKPIEIDYCVISEELLTEEEFNLLIDVLRGDVK